jgi:putative endonuclease
MDYSLYIVVCADGTYYTGIARDVDRRVMQHNGEKGKGARYTASRRPVRLVYQAHFATRSEALKEEARIKGLTRAEKELLIAGTTDALPATDTSTPCHGRP